MTDVVGSAFQAALAYGARYWLRDLPIANSAPSLRKKICPFEMAGDAISRSPMSLRAMTCGSRPARITMTSPVSLTK